MRRPALLIAVVLASTLILLTTLTLFPPPLLSQHVMMPGMGGMMAQGPGTGMSNLVWPTMLTIPTVLLIVTVTYILLFPNIKYVNEQTARSQNSTAPVDYAPMDVVMRVVKPDERAALEVLMGNDGICLQKDITYRAGLSKLRTHRVIARLAERRIVQVKKVGRTNEVTIPAWLGEGRSPAKPEPSANSPVESQPTVR